MLAWFVNSVFENDGYALKFTFGCSADSFLPRGKYLQRGKKIPQAFT